MPGVELFTARTVIHISATPLAHPVSYFPLNCDKASPRVGALLLLRAIDSVPSSPPMTPSDMLELGSELEARCRGGGSCGDGGRGGGSRGGCGRSGGGSDM